MIHDIINDPDEYLPMLRILATLLMVWAGLCLSGCISLCTATQRRGFWFALAPLVFGSIGIWAQIPISMESDGFRLSFDLSWFFVVPLLVGLGGVVVWWRAEPELAVGRAKGSQPIRSETSRISSAVGPRR